MSIQLAASFELSFANGPTIVPRLKQSSTGRTITALIGLSGCGTTTVLRCLAG